MESAILTDKLSIRNYTKFEMKNNYIPLKNNLYFIVINGNSKDMINYIKPNTIDLVITSPPYNINYNYKEYKDSLEDYEYKLLIYTIMNNSYKLLREGGLMIIHTQTDTFIDNNIYI